MAPALCVTLSILLHLIFSYTAVSSFEMEMSSKKPLFRMGDTKEVTCRIKQCSGDMTFTWGSLQDKPLHAKIKTFHNASTLIFKNIHKDMENTIQCKGRCQGVTKQAVATIQVYSFPNDPVISGHSSLVLSKENTLTCEVSNVYPAEYMTVEWLREGKVVHTEEGEYDAESIQSHYTFTPQINDDKKAIMCRVTLSLQDLLVEERTRETTVTMAVICPTVNTVISVSPNNPKEMDAMIVSCVSDSKLPSRVVLSKVFNGKETELASGNRPQISFDKADISHSGVYVCTTTTDCGRQTANVSVTVGTHPLEVSLQPDMSTTPVEQGSSMMLSCNSSGCPHANITWKNVSHRPILNWNDSLAFGSQLGPWTVGLEDNRTFVCEVQCGSVVKSARTQLKVFCPTVNATISVSPNNPKEMDAMIVSCVSDSKLPSRVVLSKVFNGKETELASGNRPQISFDKADISHSGVYVCTTTTDCGRQTANVSVTVGNYPLEVSLQPDMSTTPVGRGSSVMLSCNSSGCPHANITWKNVSHRPILNWNGSLAFGSQLGPWTVGLEDNRTFVCEVQCGSVVKSARTQLKVFSFPSDPTIETSGPFLEGKVTNLTCTVRDIFPADHFHLQWLDGELELHSVRGNFSNQVQNLNLSLAFKPQADSDRNKTLTCKVSLEMDNESLQKTASTTLDLHYPPKHTSITVRPLTKVNEGETVTIFCTTDSAPEGRVTLKRVRNGKETTLVTSERARAFFNISSTNVSDSGIYVCEAVNKYGHQNENVQITVQAPPRNIVVTVYPSKMVQEGDSVTICCQSVSFPPSDITLRKLNNGSDIYSSNGTFLLANLTSDDSGQYQVRATNALGSDTEIFTINVLQKTKNDDSIYTVLFRRLSSIDFIIPVIGLGLLALSASVLDYLRRAKRKGFYALTEGIPETV